jgi:putative membrane protein
MIAPTKSTEAQSTLVESTTTKQIDKSATQQWQRISPIAIVYFIAKFIKGLLSNIVVFLPALYFSSDLILDNPTIWLPIIVTLISLLFIGTFLSFYFFQYRLNDDHIEIRSGVISKTHINLPFSRIQNVKLEQPLYYRWFNYTCLELDTAGSAKQEAKVVALKSDFAEQLKAEILAKHHQSHIQDQAEEDQQATNAELIDEVILNTRSISDLIIHGLTNNRIWIFLGGLAPFFDDFGHYIVSFFQDFGIDLQQLLTIADKPIWQITLYAITLTFIFLFIISLFSIAGSLLTFYNYTLSKLDDRYIRRSGLLTKHEVTMRLPRLQMVVRQQDWLDVLLKRINLKFEQINIAVNQNQMNAQNDKIIVPSVKPHECTALVNDVYPDNKMMTIPYQSISKHFIIRNLALLLTPIFSVLALFFISIDKPQVLLGLIPLYAFLSLLIVMRWYRWGYATDENYTYIRKGFFGVDYYCFPTYKTQQVQYKQSWFLKRHQLCSVHYVLAAGLQSLPFINEQVGMTQVNRTLFDVESTRKSWM